MFYSTTIIEECEPLWTNFYQPPLGRRAANQLRRAMRRRENAFAANFLNPYLFRPDLGAGLYVPVDSSKYSEGRNHLMAEDIALRPEIFAIDDDPRTGLSYFANPLRTPVPRADALVEGQAIFESPSSRVILAPIQIFTFEFDQPCLDFLGQQLAWVRSRKNPLDCQMGALYRHCATYADFAGLTVNYSGNKGVHVHVAFRTDLAAAAFHGLTEAGAAIRTGLIEHWCRLHRDVLRVLEVPDGITADIQVRFPEQFRRMPNGLRLLERPSLVGVPAGEIVPQVTLWEKWPERAAKDASELFFMPASFAGREVHQPTPASPARSSSAFKVRLTPEEFKCCEDQLAARFADWPKFVRLEPSASGWRALFQNNADDRTPSSVMLEGHKAIMINGRGADQLRPKRLPLPLGAMMKLWVKAHRADQSAAPWDIVEIPMAPGGAPSQPCKFAAAIRTAATKDEASRHLRKALLATVRKHDVALVSAPEGIRKTSSLFADHQCNHTRMIGAKHMPSMYAFNDYASARTKCEEFNKAHSGSGFHAVVLPSFSEAYKAARANLKCPEFTTATAAEFNLPTVWAAISKRQPKVIDHFRATHEAMWREIGDRSPVFFTVHQVAQTWNTQTPTRAMWDRSFWDVHEPFADKLHISDCRRRMALGLLVHDEVEVGDLVVMHRAETVGWVRRLMDQDPETWGANRGDLAGLWSSYRKFSRANPCPTVGGEVQNIDFHTAREIARIGLNDWDTVEAGWSGVYGDDDEKEVDLYTRTVGRQWCVAPRTWWRSVAKRVLVLTTEGLPTAIARRIGAPWHVADYEASGLERDYVTVLAGRSVRSEKLLSVVDRFQREHPGVMVISNKVSALDGTTTHARARGSNAYIGQDVAQTMTFLSPAEYERLEALNAWCGRDDLVAIRHIDEFNQSAGRNLGFRREGDPRHWLMISPRLLNRLLARDALGRARYDLRIQLDRQRRWVLRGRAA